jgi:hypothetical protein
MRKEEVGSYQLYHPIMDVSFSLSKIILLLSLSRMSYEEKLGSDRAASKQYKNKVKSYDMEEVDSRVYPHSGRRNRE